MSKFEKAVEVVLKHEGGFVSHPSDPGGATNMGVSLRFLHNEGYGLDLDGDGDVDAVDVRLMKKYHAVDIYKEFWWDKFNYESIDDERVATKVFDLSVNMGASRAHKLLQTALNKLGNKLTVDGKIGPNTLRVINSTNGSILVDALSNEAWGFYQRLIANNPSFKAFEKGWKNRAFASI